MRFLDQIRNDFKARGEKDELRILYGRLRKYVDEAEGYRNEFCANVVAHTLGLSTGNPAVVRSALLFCHALLAFEGHLYLPAVDINNQHTMSEVWKIKSSITSSLQLFEQPQIADLLGQTLNFILKELTEELPRAAEAENDAASLAVPLYTYLRNPAEIIEAVLRLPYRDDLIRANLFEGLRVQFHRNVCLASGIDPDRAEKSSKALVLPTQADLPPAELIGTYLACRHGSSIFVA